MYELIQAAEHTYYIQCPAKMGIWKMNGTDAVLIDSGNDKDAGRKVQKIFDAQGWRLTAILNTHANADHNGGNALLQQRLGVPAFAPGIDAAITSHPIHDSVQLCVQPASGSSNCLIRRFFPLRWHFREP
ncbi:MBL fold metallo-hydrolase [Oscillospiraceae bacterium 50-60]